MEVTQTLRDFQNSLYIAANTSWENIETQTSVIQRSNGDIDVFVTMVTTALGVRDQARQTRQEADAILTGPYVGQASNNAVQLAAIQAVVNDWPLQLSGVRAAVQGAEENSNLATNQAAQASTLVDSLNANMASQVTTGQLVVTSSSNAKAGSQVAQTAIEAYFVSQICDAVNVVY